jgi:hypothetical protein
VDLAAARVMHDRSGPRLLDALLWVDRGKRIEGFALG